MTEEQPNHYILDDGSERWELDDKLHRLDGPALLLPGGDEVWYRHGEIHRDEFGDLGGPAIIRGHGTREWWKHGQKHREDGPAIEHADGREKWFLNGQELSEEAVAERVEKRLALQRRAEAESVASIMAEGTRDPVVPLRPLKFTP